MLELPEKGNKREPAIHVLADWIEASLLFNGPRISVSDIRDVLCDAKVCATQAEADSLAFDIWNRLLERQRRLGDGTILLFKDQHVECTKKWADVSAYAYFLLVSYTAWHPKAADVLGKDYSEQGSLFEEITKEAMPHVLPGWQVHHTGWTKTKAQKISEVVKGVAVFLNDAPYEDAIGEWVKEQDNEAGLDMVLLRRFADGEGRAPLYLMQCASGEKWELKAHEPRFQTWQKLINFSHSLHRAFSSPLSILEGAHKPATIKLDGVLFDRYRLLYGHKTNLNWTSKKLNRRINGWLRPRVRKLTKNFSL